MTYPKVIAFLIPGPSCYGNITLLLSKPLMWHFKIMIYFWKVPSQPSGGCQLCPGYLKPPAQAGQQGMSDPRAVSAAGGSREGAKGLCFTQIPQKENIPQPCPQHGTQKFTPADGKCFHRALPLLSLWDCTASPSAWRGFFPPFPSFPRALGWNKQASISLERKIMSELIQLLCEVTLHMWQWSRSSSLSSLQKSSNTGEIGQEESKIHQ